MELTHIEHLGIAVKSIEACLPYYEEVLGAEGLNIAFLHPKSTCSVLTELCMPGK